MMTIRLNILLIWLCMLLSISSADAQYRHLTISNGLNGQNVNCITKDDKGIMWFGTDFGVTCLLSDKVINFTFDDGRMHNVTRIVICPNGSMFALANGSGIYSTDITNLTLHRVCPEVDRAVDMCVIDNTLYVKTQEGYVRILNGKSKILNKYGQDAKLCNRIDRKLNSHDNIVSHDDDNPLHRNNLLTIYRDKQLGISWYGYFLDGLLQTYPTNPIFDVYRFGELDTRGMSVRSFCIHGDDMLIGTRQGFYHVNEKRNLVNYYSPEATGAKIITNIKWFADKFVIASFDGGLYTFDGKDLTSVSNSSFACLTLSNDSSRLFACGGNTLYVYDTNMNEVARFNHTNSSLPDTYIPDVYIDSRNKVWISTMKGLSIYDPVSGSVQSAGFPSGFFNEESDLAFCSAGKDSLWAFSQSGLYSSSDDLSSFSKVETIISGIEFLLPIDEARLLVGTNRGLFITDNNFSSIRHYGMESGLPSLVFNKKEIQRMPDGTIWMANCQGLLKLSADMFAHLDDSLNSKCAISAINLDGRLNTDGEILQLTRTGNISITWNLFSESMEIIPCLLNYAESGNHFYEWMIDDDGWNVSDNRSILLSSLLPGKHVFRLRISGHPESMAEYAITVMPSWIFWFELLFVIVFIVCVAMSLNIYKRHKVIQLKLQQKHELEKQIIAEQTEARILREVEESKLQEQERLRKAMVDRLSSKESKDLIRKIKEYMDTQHPYRNASFRLSELASAIGTSSTNLSIIFNQQLNTSFYDFVNHYRIEEFKMRVNDSNYSKYTIMALSEMCGFKKSTFFATFKKFEGCTPSEYVATVVRL